MIGSIAPDVVATVREPPYALSKAAVRALVLAIAKAGGPFNVRCNEVITGLVTGTRFTDSRPERAAAALERGATRPPGRRRRHRRSRRIPVLGTIGVHHRRGPECKRRALSDAVMPMGRVVGGRETGKGQRPE